MYYLMLAFVELYICCILFDMKHVSFHHRFCIFYVLYVLKSVCYYVSKIYLHACIDIFVRILYIQLKEILYYIVQCYILLTSGMVWDYGIRKHIINNPRV